MTFLSTNTARRLTLTAVQVGPGGAATAIYTQPVAAVRAPHDSGKAANVPTELPWPTHAATRSSRLIIDNPQLGSRVRHRRQNAVLFPGNPCCCLASIPHDNPLVDGVGDDLVDARRRPVTHGAPSGAPRWDMTPIQFA